MKRQLTTTSLAVITLLASSLSLPSSATPVTSTQPVKHDVSACQSVIKSYIDWANSPAKPNEYPHGVYATLAYHYPDTASSPAVVGVDNLSNYVWYGNGPVYLSQNSFQGTLGVWTTSPAPPTAWTGGFYSRSPQIKYQVKISSTGLVTSTKLLNGKPIGGISPGESYQASCASGVLTAATAGGTYTLSLKKVLVPPVPK